MSKIDIKKELCKGCGFCVDACPRKIINYSNYINKLGYIAAEYSGQGCNGCGFCFYSCPEPDAIIVYKEDKTEDKK